MIRIALFALAWIALSYAIAPKSAAVPPDPMLQKSHGREISATSSAAGESRKGVRGDISYHVVHVVDGDTIDVEKDGVKVRVRLIGINAPESVDPRRPVQCFGIEASNEMKRILDGQSVRLEQDPSQDTYDKYHRLLAYVFLPDGTNVNEHMIAAGFAHEYTYRLPYRYQKEFKAAEAAAREAERGLWNTGVCAN